MSDTLDFNIRQQLADYVMGNITLRQFENWFFAETWDIDEEDNQALQTLCMELAPPGRVFSWRLDGG